MIEYDLLTVAQVVIVVLFGGIMQSTVGFAYALFSTPLLVLIGIPLPSTIVIVAICSMVQSIMGASRLRADVRWRLAGVALIIRMAGVAIGILWLKRLAGLPLADIRLMVGLILCGLVALQWLFHVEPSDRLHPLWGGLAFLCSGLLAGVVGMGGPPLVLWAMAHNWSNERTRGFLFSVFMISIPLQLAMLYISFGPVMLRDVRIGFLLAPAVFVGSVIGMPIGNRIPRPILRSLAYGILGVIGLSAVLPRMLAGLAR